LGWGLIEHNERPNRYFLASPSLSTRAANIIPILIDSAEAGVSFDVPLLYRLEES
jgi:hypothetical protein